MNRAKVVVLALVALLALVLQVSILPHVAVAGVVANLVLVVVVVAGLNLSASQTLVFGFAAGLLLDLAPPADHAAGRWALALTVVAWVVARARPEVRPSAGWVVALVAACSFVGCSVYALSGLLIGDPVGSVGDVLGVIALAVLLDLVATPFVVPGVQWLLRRMDRRAGREAARA